MKRGKSHITAHKDVDTITLATVNIVSQRQIGWARRHRLRCHHRRHRCRYHYHRSRRLRRQHITRTNFIIVQLCSSRAPVQLCTYWCWYIHFGEEKMMKMYVVNVKWAVVVCLRGVLALHRYALQDMCFLRLFYSVDFFCACDIIRTHYTQILFECYVCTNITDVWIDYRILEWAVLLDIGVMRWRWQRGRLESDACLMECEQQKDDGRSGDGNGWQAANNAITSYIAV